MNATKKPQTARTAIGWKSYLPATLILCVGIGLSGVAFAGVRKWQSLAIWAEFRRAAEDRIAALKRATEDNRLMLESIRSFYAGSERVERDEFSTFVKPFFSHIRGLQALEWIPHIPNAQRAEFEAAARSAGFSDFQISQRRTGGEMVRASPRNEYFPIFYLESHQDHKAALGFDVASHPMRREALLQARDSGQIVATGPLTLPAQTEEQPGFELFLPVYKTGGRGNSIQQRRADLQGFVGAVFHPGRMVQGFLASLESRGINMWLCDESAPEGKRLLYFHPSRLCRPGKEQRSRAKPRHPQGMHTFTTLPVAGREWSILCTPVPGFPRYASRWYAWAVLGGGLMSTVLAALYLFSATAQAAKLAAANAELKREADHCRAISQRLHEREDQFHKMTNSAQDAIIIMDHHGNVSFWNEAARKIFGYTQEEVIGKNVHALLPAPQYRDQHQQAFPEFQRTGRGAAVGKIVQLDAVRKNGEQFPIELSLAAVNLDDQWHAIAIVRDITERERRDQALREAKQEAEAASRAKSTFLANMSHEIRTPMTAILGFADVLLGMVEGAEAVEAVQTIKRNGEHLLTIINDILDLSKIEAGRLKAEQMRCSPCDIVAEVASLMRVRADAKGLPLTVEYRGPIPETITTDPTRLRQILVNLVGNAIKFTQAGSIRLVIRLVEDGGDGPKLQFDVVDTGIGMTEDQIGRLFHPFTQGDTSTCRKFGGTGLGLAISHRLAGILGGEITVSSSPGKGSTFSLTVATGPLDGVPMIARQNEAGPAGKQTDQPGPKPHTRLNCRILLAEDGPDNQRLIAFLLEKAGAKVTVVENGRKALERALAAACPAWGKRYDDPTEPFHLILMDMQMPVMDGYEATRRLRAQGYTGPIVALTAHAMSHDRQQCLEAGCDDYLSKPIHRDKLLTVVAEQVRKAREGTPAVGEAQPPSATVAEERSNDQGTHC